MLESLGVGSYLGGTTRFVMTYVWVTVAAFIAFAMPNTQEIMRRFDPALEDPRATMAPSLALDRLTWSPRLGWSVAIGLLLGAGLLSLSRPPSSSTSSSDPMVPRTRYLCGLGASLAALLVAVIVCNLIIDPYGYVGAPRIPGLNALKPGPGSQLVPVKKAALSRAAPDALILGNSRAEVGFDPEHPAWAKRGLEAYNAAIRGAGLEVAVRMLETARQTQEPEVVIVGLDVLDFLTAPDAAVRPYPSAPAESVVDRFQRWFGAVATFGALRDSVRTIIAQHERYPEIITDRGLNPLREYEGIARVEGYHAMFAQRAQENARAYVRKPSGIFVEGTRSSPSFAIVEGLVERARQRGTELHLLIYPYHAQILVMFEAAGLWPAFEEWKRRLAEIAVAGGDAVVLWDFSGFSTYATEAIPGPGDRKAELRWYWEAGHFKKALGDVVLERVFLSKGGAESEGFGVRLTPANVDAHLGRIRERRDEFRALQPSLVADVEELVRRAR